MANFGPKTPFLAISGPRDPPWLEKVEKIADHSGTHVGGLLQMQNLSEKCTQWYGNGPKMANFGQKTPFLAIRGPKGFRWLVKVDQRVDHSGTHVGGLLQLQNSSEKCTQWYGNGPKTANIGQKTQFLAISGPQRPPVDGKSGTNGRSQQSTCGGTTLDAKLFKKMHKMVWKWPKKWPNLGPKHFFWP